MTLTSEPDTDKVKVNQDAKYLVKRHLFQELLSRYPDMHTHWSDCSTWTTKMVSKLYQCKLYQ